jgi:hypothetical protein
MKISFAIFILFFLNVSVGCSPYKKATISQDTKAYIKMCSDSLNSIATTKIIPHFLYNPCLDYQKGYWINLHTPISLRKMIVDRVNNKQSLEYVLQLQVFELTQYCSRRSETDTIGLNYYTVPYIEKNFEQLLKERYNEIE